MTKVNLVNKTSKSQKTNLFVLRFQTLIFASLAYLGLGGFNSAHAESKDYTLGGIDISLSLDAFKAKYGEKIKECSGKTYSDDSIGEENAVDIVVCTLKEDDDAYANFYEGRLYLAQIKLEQKGVKMRLASRALEKKIRRKPKSTTYFGSLSMMCAVEGQFYHGTATLLSDNVLFEEKVMARARAGENIHSCTPDIFSDAEAEYIRYEDPTIKKEMLRKMKQKKDHKEEKKADGFSL